MIDFETARGVPFVSRRLPETSEHCHHNPSCSFHMLKQHKLIPFCDIV